MIKTIRLFSILALIALFGAVSPALAQSDDTTAAATPAVAAMSAATPTGPKVTVSGLVDTYYTYNFTNSSKGMNGFGNVGYNYGGVGLNSMDDVFSLGVGELVVQASEGPLSGVVALWTQGQMGINGMNLLVANATYTTGQFSFTAGRFGDWMGNEKFETNQNWNYSHSLMYNDTLPLWLQGVSVGFKPSSSFGITGYATEGWVNDPGNNDDYGKTYGLQISLKPDSTWGLTLNGVAGPNDNFFNLLRQTDSLYVGEAIISYTASNDLSLALDGEYGGIDPVAADGLASLSSETFWGAALYGKYQLASDWALALRLEELESSNDWLYNSGKGAGPYLETREVTLTVSHNVTTNLLCRLEGRYDMGYTGGTRNDPTATPALPGPYADAQGSQLTGTASAVFSF